MEVDRVLIDRHRQKYTTSCVPSCVEMVLKLLGRLAPDSYEFQDALGPDRFAGFGDFNDKELRGLRFRQRFTQQRSETFPFDELFDFIGAELAAGRFVLVSLQSGPPQDQMVPYHMWVVHQSQGNEFLAFSKSNSATIHCSNVRAQISEMHGTDILTYELTEPAA